MSQTQTRRSPANRTMPPAASAARHATARLAELPPTLTIEEAGDMLGISRRSAYRAAARGELPTLRLGRRLLVPTPRLLALLGLPVSEPTDEPTPAPTAPAAVPSERARRGAAKPLRPPAERGARR